MILDKLDKLCIQLRMLRFAQATLIPYLGSDPDM
jgi:hypothetical protein